SAFVQASDENHWPDKNVRALVDNAEKRADERLNRNLKAATRLKRSNGRIKPVPPEIAEKIAEYRADRVNEVLASYISPSPPLWIRNRTPERCVLIADAWEAREMLRKAGLTPS